MTRGGYIKARGPEQVTRCTVRGCCYLLRDSEGDKCPAHRDDIGRAYIGGIPAFEPARRSRRWRL